jgi:hypothetical protein
MGVNDLIFQPRDRRRSRYRNSAGPTANRYRSLVGLEASNNLTPVSISSLEPRVAPHYVADHINRKPIHSTQYRRGVGIDAASPLASIDHWCTDGGGYQERKKMWRSKVFVVPLYPHAPRPQAPQSFAIHIATGLSVFSSSQSHFYRSCSHPSSRASEPF